MSEIKITLETLYDVLRNEKNKEDLQELESSFYIDVVSYLREKKALLDSKNDEDELFTNNEKEKLEYELRSLKRILKEIYEKREKKMIEIALNKSRTRSDIIDTSHMLREEKEFYQKMVQHLDNYRKGVLLNLFKGELPFIEDILRKKDLSNFTEPSIIEEEKEIVKENKTFKKFEHVVNTSNEPEKEKEEVKSDEELEPEQESKVDFTKIKFLQTVPKFIWKDMKEYGPFKIDEEAPIFSEIAELLIRKGRAEKI